MLSPLHPRRVVMIPNSEMWDSNPFYMPLKQPVITFSYLYQRYQTTSQGQHHLISSALSPKSATRNCSLNTRWRFSEKWLEKKRKDTREIKSLGVIWHISESAATTPLCFLWSEVTQSCLTLRNLVDRSLPGSSVHGFLQARILEWVPFPSLGDLPNAGIEPRCPTLEADALTSEPLGKP